MTSSYQDTKKRKKPITRQITLAYDQDQAVSYDTARSVLNRLEQKETVGLNPAEKKEHAAKIKVARIEFEEAEQILKDNSITFKMQALKPSVMDEIIARHPPTPKQKKEAAEKGMELAWNAETMPPELVSACLVEPDWSLEDVQDMFDSDEWNQAELMALFSLALEVNNTRSIVDIKKD